MIFLKIALVVAVVGVGGLVLASMAGAALIATAINSAFD